MDPEAEPNAAPWTGLVIVKSQQLEKIPPSLHKSYFDHPTLSDLTIQFSGRSIYVHRIVLSRGSEYFASLLTGKFQESKSKEVELHEDDPEALMALFRHFYGLPYAANLPEWHDGLSLLPHVLVYITAGRYQSKTLQVEAYSNMRNIFRLQTDDRSRLLESSDLLDAVRAMFAGTTSNDKRGRGLSVKYCAYGLSRFAENQGFMTLVEELPELGAELIRQHFAKDYVRDEEEDAFYKYDDNEKHCNVCHTTIIVVCSRCGN